MTNETNGQTLLEKALAASQNNKLAEFSSQKKGELLDLAIAYCRHEVTHAQAATALGKPGKNVAGELISCLVTASRHGLIRIECVEQDKAASA